MESYQGLRAEFQHREREILTSLIRHTGSLSKTAKALQIAKSTLSEKLKALGVMLPKTQTDLAELVKATASQQRGDLDHKRSLASAKEQEKRRLELKYNNTMDAITEESDKAIRQGLSEKAKELWGQLEATKAAILELKAELDEKGQLIDLSEAMAFLKDFRNGAFDEEDVSNQAEILRSFIRRIIVSGNKVSVELYAGSEGSGEEDSLTSSRSQGSNVRSVFKLVHPDRRVSNCIASKRLNCS